MAGAIDSLVIRPSVREFLKYQRGAIKDLADEPEDVWTLAFLASVNLDWAQILPGLPQSAPVYCLDVGAGMGTIDIFLSRHYQKLAPSQPSSFVLADGMNDPPKISKSYRTHSSATPALEYMGDNGVEFCDYISPAGIASLKDRFDLVISLGSWCFHYEPRTYLNQILRLTHPETTFILDLRKNRPTWDDQLRGKLEIVTLLADLPKAERVQMRKVK